MKQFKFLLLILPLGISLSSAQGDTVKVKMGPDGQEAERCYNAGLALFHTKNFQQAVDSFSKAITLKADFEKAFYNRGLAY